MRPEVYKQCLVTERAGYLAAGDPSKVIAVDEELSKLGFVVDSATGELVELDKVTRSVKPKRNEDPQPPPVKENTAAAKLPEKAVEA